MTSTTSTPVEAGEATDALKRSLAEVRQKLLDNKPIEVKVKGRSGTRIITAHPETTKLPVLDQEAMEGLARDVARNGFTTKVTLHVPGVTTPTDDNSWDAEKMHVLLGRHRVAVAAVLGIPVPASMFAGDDVAAKAQVVASDISRRQMSDAQMALYVVENLLDEISEAAAQRQRDGMALATTGTKGRAPRSSDIASMLVGGIVSGRSIDRIKKHVPDAPKTRAKVLSGEYRTVSKAASKAKEELGIKSEPKATAAAKDGKGKAGGSGSASSVSAKVTEAPSVSKRLSDHIVAAEKIRAALGDLDRMPTEASMAKWLTQLDQHEVITSAIRASIADLRRAKQGEA
jgi:hypothetical protein